MPVCSDCGVNGGCGCLFTRRAGRLLCGLCSGVATLEKAAEIRYLRETQGIGQQRGREEKNMALKSVLAKQKPVVKKTHAPVALPKVKPGWRHETGFQEPVEGSFDSSRTEIPKIFHWVWVGSNPFPEKDAAWLQSWRRHHPDWRFLIWCEHPENVQLEGFESLPLVPLVNRKYFYEIENWVTGKAALAARSDIVRYEVVARYGGVYLDTDVECFKAIDELLNGVRLFVSDEWGPSPGNYMFGAVANHPALWTVVRDMGPHLSQIQGKVNAVDAVGPPYLNNQLRQYSHELVIFPHMLFNPVCAFDNPDLVEIWPKCSYGNHHYDGKWYDRDKDTIAPEFLN